MKFTVWLCINFRNEKRVRRSAGMATLLLRVGESSVILGRGSIGLSVLARDRKPAPLPFYKRDKAVRHSARR
jgi:hypothetical protein